MANSLRGTPRQGGWTTDGKRFARYTNTSVEKCGFPGSLCTSSVPFICARCLCTLSVHIVCARRLCTLSAHVVCALWLTLVDSCREGSHRTTRRRNACHLASPSCHRIPGGSRRPVFACTCCADMHCPTCAGPGLMWFACLVPCHSVLPNIIIESI